VNKKSFQAMNEKCRLYDKGYVFDLSEDKVTGVIRRVRTRTDPIELTDIAEILKVNDIQYGIVDPSILTKTLADNPRPTEPWTIAKGKLPIPAEKDQLVYHFEIDPLRIGTLLETGFMDYKDRGKIPQVKEGTLVAEKIPGKKGMPGIDIFGEPVPQERPPVVKLMHGTGVVLSEDGLKAFAKTDGRPVKSADGKVHVFGDLNIDGDIGIRTGHVDFEGHIEVAGIVNPGYKVKGGSLCTQEINNARCDAVGTINVLGGINGARLTSGGNLRARYIHQSVIEARGDVIVDKDVSNSTIVAGGRVIVDNGKILTSKVQAKMGITAVGIGSKASETCELIVGIDSQIEAALKRIDGEMADLEERRLMLEANFDELNKHSGELETTIASATEVQTGTRQKMVQLAEKVKSLDPSERNDAWKIKAKIDTLRTASERSMATIPKLREKHQLVFEKMEGVRGKIEGVEKQIAHLEGVLQELDDFSQIKDGVFERHPIVETLGTIHAGTTVKGPHASLIIRSNNSQVKVVEVKLEKKDAAKPWRMVVKPRKGR
jgi:uncharacterized protein (DUF342 family)